MRQHFLERRTRADDGNRHLLTPIGTISELGQAQPPSEAALPIWDELPLAVREAFVAVFFAGCRDAMREEAERVQEEGG